jgi:hypothetical protein
MRLLAALAVVGVVAGALSLPGAGDWIASASVGSMRGMSHGSASQAGILDDGDMGNYLRKPSADRITSQAAARSLGQAPIAGDLGDVIVFRPNGVVRLEANKPAFLEHRALAWVSYNATSGLFDVPELGLWSVGEVTLPDVGFVNPATGAYERGAFRLALVQETPEGRTYPAGMHSGWVTKGDREAFLDQALPEGGSAPVGSMLVQPSWVEAKLTRVIDGDTVVRDVFLGTGLVLVGGVAWLRFRGRLRAGRPKAHGEESPPLVRRRALRPRKQPLAKLLRAACEDCQTPWGAEPFCVRCGAERYPRHRYATAPARGPRRRAP